jgi:hypothetical protein
MLSGDPAFLFSKFNQAQPKILGQIAMTVRSLAPPGYAAKPSGGLPCVGGAARLRPCTVMILTRW